jgi:hypothetical protein
VYLFCIVWNFVVDAFLTWISGTGSMAYRI